MLRCIGFGSNKTENPVGVVSGTGPNLLTVNYPVIAIELRLRGQTRQITTGTGFGVALTPNHVGFDSGLDKSLLLLLSTHLEQDWSQHGDTLSIKTAMHTLGAEFLCNDARLNDIGLRAIATVITSYRSAMVAMLDKKTLPITHGLALDAVTWLWLLVLVGTNKRLHFLTERVVLTTV